MVTPPPAAPDSPSSGAPLPPSVGWAAPVAARQEVAPGLVLSDTPSRFVAYVIDLVILGLVTSIIAEPLGWVTPMDAAGPQGDEVFLTTEYTILASLIGALYFIASWSGGRRATLGQRLFRIQVGNAFDGRPLTLSQAVRRWLGIGDWLNLLGVTVAVGLLSSGLLLIWTIVLLITTATSPTKQGLHDKFANSAVVRPADAGTGLAYACLAIVVILVVVSIVSIVALIALGSQVSTILSQVGESI
jgi:uncharacterized RDD family membrane protein YckC